jgi:hypothetical protein
MPGTAHAETIELCRFDGEQLAEISGLASSTLHEGIVWAHNDSGGGPRIYALDTASCEIRAVLRVQGIEARDPEAIAVGIGSRGVPVIWWGDIGDNTAQRRHVEIHEIPEPSTLVSGDVEAITYRVRLPDRQDAEALLADSDQLWMIGKGLLGGTVWKLPRLRSDRADSTVRAQAIAVEGPLVTDAAMRPGGGYAVRDYSEVRIYSGLPPGDLVSRMPLPSQVQGEAMTWNPDGSALIIASEGDDRLLLVPIDAEQGGSGQSESAPQSVEASVASPTPPSPNDTTSAEADIVTDQSSPAALESVDRVGSLAALALVVGVVVFVVSAVAAAIIARLRARG